MSIVTARQVEHLRRLGDDAGLSVSERESLVAAVLPDDVERYVAMVKLAGGPRLKVAPPMPRLNLDDPEELANEYA